MTGVSWIDGRSRHCCGINDIYNFFHTNNPDPITTSGTGLLVASFINNRICKAAYEKLKQETILLYQSPVRRNRNSGSKVFMCVYMNKSRKDK